jgi:acetate kinase
MTKSRILTINGGSSSIKFALYQTGEPLKRSNGGRSDDRAPGARHFQNRHGEEGINS